MRAILVDDEKLALQHLENQLRKMSGIDIVGVYQHSEDVPGAVSELSPDVVFLDIDMPVMTGIEVAEHILMRAPDTFVVFITAYDEYAIKAFELNAVDYLLKPLDYTRLQTTIERLKHRLAHKPAAKQSAPEPMLRCFKTLQYGGLEPVVLPWRTAKAQQLFAYLVHHRGQQVRKDTLIELLWPEVDLKKSLTQMYTSMYQLRQALQAVQLPAKVHSLEKGYQLDLQGVRIDVDEWERKLSELAPPDEHNLAEHKQLLEIYRGDYFEDYDYIWAENERERLRTLWYEHALSVADCLGRIGRYAEALSLYHKIRDQFPYSEEIYLALMKLHHAHGNLTAVQKQYHELCEVLTEEFGAAPSPEIREWYNEHMDPVSS